MKKLIFPLFLLIILFFSSPSFSQTDTNFVLFEGSTGTWCQWCPCGHVILEQILQAYPKTLALEYHGPVGNDPYATNDTYAMITSLGLNAYPTATIGRRTGQISRSAWFSWVMAQSVYTPGVRMSWSKTYNPGTRQLTVNLSFTALSNLVGNYYVNYVMTESNLIYSQSGNSSCTGGSNYVHNHVVRAMINGTTGDLLNSGGTWNNGVVITKTLNYTVPAGWAIDNCEFGAFVYMQGSPLNSAATVQQTKKQMATQNTTGIQNYTEFTNNYFLNQNYPNPFNPTTYIKFSIPKNEHVTFKIYDILGNLVSTYCDQDLKAGIYNVEFDGTNLPSGTYFYKIIAGSFTETKRMMLVK
jgi:hypothetical protein